MTEVLLLAKTLTTDLTPFYSLAGTEAEPPHVLLTNVLYYDDAEMQRLLERKRIEYPQGTTFSTSMHELARPVTNSTAATVVVDCFNLYVSNLLLLYNSDPANMASLRDFMTADLTALFESLLQGSGPARLLLLTGDVDFDYFIRTEAGILYRQLLYQANSLAAPHADGYGLLTNGNILWLKTPF